VPSEPLRRARPGARLPGEEEMGGVMAGIDAVGFQARDRHHPDREDPRQVIAVWSTGRA